jgi:DNA-binding NtrC family response regulator
VKPSVLLVDDEPDLRLALELFLARSGFRVSVAGSLAGARSAILEQAVDGVLLDRDLPDGSGLAFVPELREARPAAAIVMLTGRGDPAATVEALRRGADHVLTKPVDLAQLEVVLRRGLELCELRARRRAERRLERHAEPFLGESASARSGLEAARRAAAQEAPVLLLGEAGCGKGVVARFVHEAGERAALPFVGLRCTGLGRQALEDEIFGRAGDATFPAREGLLGVADGGTLFLAGIGDLALELQARLLEVVETKRYHARGEARDRRSDVRLLASSRRDLSTEVARGRFSAALLARFAGPPIELPPLRERPEDIGPLACRLLPGLEPGEARLDPVALRVLGGYPWPGNVRELRSALERARLLAGSGELRAEHFSWLTPPVARTRPDTQPDTQEGGA